VPKLTIAGEDLLFTSSILNLAGAAETIKRKAEI